MDDTNELELLRRLLAECNKSLRQLEKENARLAAENADLVRRNTDLEKSLYVNWKKRTRALRKVKLD